MFCLDRLCSVLFPQETTLCDDYWYLVLKPLWIRSEGRGGCIAQESEHGRRLQSRDFDALLAQVFDLHAFKPQVFFFQLLCIQFEDVADTWHGVVAGESFGRKVDGAAQRNCVAWSDAINVVRLQPVSLFGRDRSRVRLGGFAVVGIGVKFVLDGGYVGVVDIAGCLETTGVEHRLCDEEVIEDFEHLDGTVNVRRVAALDEGRREEGVVAVTVGDEDVLWTLLVDAETSVKKQIELWDHK